MKPVNTFLFAILLLLITNCGQAQSIQLIPTQVKRIAKTSQLWGHIKYFHPYLTNKSINWEEAFIQNIDKVISSGSSDEFAEAIQKMLDELNDPSTKVILKNTSQAKKDSTKYPQIKFLNDSILLVSVRDYNDLENFYYCLEQFSTLKEKIPISNGLVFDLRSHSDIGGTKGYLAYYFENINSCFSDSEIQLPGLKARFHDGFVPETGGTSGGYYSGEYTKDKKVVSPAEIATNQKVVFIANKYSEIPMIAVGLQKAGKAIILSTETLNDASVVETASFELEEGVNVNIRLNQLSDGFDLKTDYLLPENISDNDIIKISSKYINGEKIDLPIGSKSNKTIVEKKNKQSKEIGNYPDKANRLLAAAKIWTVIDYFFAYKELMNDDWEQVLIKSIPRIAIAADSMQYHLAIAEMYKHIQDGHGYINSSVLSEYFGAASPPITIRFIENLPVVTYNFPDSIHKVKDIEVGDIVLEIDGENALNRAKRYANYISASNEPTHYNYVSYRLLNGEDSSFVKLKIKNKNNKLKTVQLHRNTSFYKYARQHGKGRSHQAIFRLINKDIGYADLDRLKSDMVDKMFEEFKNTKAIIFDMRGYPNGTAWTIAPHLTNKKNVIAANFRRYKPMNMRATTEGMESMAIFNQTIPEPKPPYYKGKTYMLIDERTQSQAEHTGLFFEAANGTKFIGSQTAGANGDVTNFIIPGKITLYFSGHDVRHADGRQLQKTGLVPDVKVKPTIKGIREGKDEVLDKALEIVGKEI